LKGYQRGEKPIDCRPAEVLEPELGKAAKDVNGLAVDIDDELIYALYPVTGKRFLKWKYGKEQPPEEVKPKTLEDVKAVEETVRLAKAGNFVGKTTSGDAPPASENMRKFNVFVNGEYFAVGVDEAGGTPAVRYVQSAAVPLQPSPAQAAPQPAAAPEPKTDISVKAEPEPSKKGFSASETPLIAPMPGMIVNYKKKVGDSVIEGETVVILEAMKMENALPAPKEGNIKTINFQTGDSVAKGDVLCVLE